MSDLIRFYLIYDPDGKIREIGDAGHGFTFDKEAIQFQHPGQKVIEIDEETYQKLDGQLENFKIVGGKIRKKTSAERKKIEDMKKEWAENNTIQGLRKKIIQLEKRLSQMDNIIKQSQIKKIQ